MIVRNGRRKNDALKPFLLIASLFAVFGFASYQLGWHSATLRSEIKQALAAVNLIQSDHQSQSVKTFVSEPPTSLDQALSGSVVAAEIEYHDTGE